MSVPYKIPPKSELVDSQYFQVIGGDGVLTGYLYDAHTSTLYFKEAQIIIPSHHGTTHVETGSDAVPCATTDTGGLLCADDKAKLDAVIQTRIGVLGYQGSGYPDDGGWITGDLILAAGSEFISLERVGNVIRFTVQSLNPLSCSCESCAQIYWIQDETEPNAIRPPSCNGTLPGVNDYGELKVYLMPENAVIDPSNPSALLNTKGQYPSFIFKRYDDGMTPAEAEIEVVLKRNSNLTTHTGWAMTPGATGVVQTVWFTGKDKAGEQIKFELLPENETNLLGALLYKGHSLTRQMAVITDYTSQVLSNNQYKVRKWDVRGAQVVGSEFTATNVWKYDNPENTPSNPTAPKALVLDATKTLVPIGTLVELWEFQIGLTSAGARITRSYFREQPETPAESNWSLSAAVRFGDIFKEREDLTGDEEPSDATVITVNDIRTFERKIWGITTFEDRLVLSDDGGIGVDGVREPSGEPINNLFVADIDTTIPGMIVSEMPQLMLADINHDGVVNDEDRDLFMQAYGSKIGDPNYNADADLNKDGIIDRRDLSLFGAEYGFTVRRFNERPVFLWHRGNHRDIYLKTLIGMPSSSDYPPYDILLRAPVDSFDDTYVKIIRRGVFSTGTFSGAPFVVVKGVRWSDLPQSGTLRILTGAFRNALWHYFFKASFSPYDDNSITLIGIDEIFPFDEDFVDMTNLTSITAGVAPVPENTTVAELLHEDFTSPCVRLEFSVNNTSSAEAVQLQIKVGTLDMSVPYDLDKAHNPTDSLIRGFAPGYTVSKIMTQDGFITDGIGHGITSDPEDFRVYYGGELPAPVGSELEKWNELEIMYRDSQLWLWWNGMIVPPDTLLSAALPTPVAVSTPYYPLTSAIPVGKAAFRMWPGAVMRAADIRDNLSTFNEFTHGQLTVIS